MTPGRRPKPVALRIISANKAAPKGVKGLGVKTDAEINIDPPDHLGPDGIAEWERVMQFIGPLRIAQESDRAMLGCYCASYEMWRRAEKEMQETGYRLTHINESGNPVKNPLVAIISTAKADMLRYAGEFGLTPVARARIGVGNDKPKGADFGNNGQRRKA